MNRANGPKSLHSPLFSPPSFGPFSELAVAVAVAIMLAIIVDVGSMSVPSTPVATCRATGVGDSVATVADGIGENDVEIDALSRVNDEGDGSNPGGGCIKQKRSSAFVNGDYL